MKNIYIYVVIFVTLLIGGYDMWDTCLRFDKLIYSNDKTQINITKPNVKIDKCNHHQKNPGIYR